MPQSGGSVTNMGTEHARSSTDSQMELEPRQEAGRSGVFGLIERMASSTTSKGQSFLTPRVVRILFLIGAFLLGAAVVVLLYQITGAARGGGPPTPPPDVSPPDEKPAELEKRRLIKDMLLPRDAQPYAYDLRLKAYLPGYGASIPEHKNLTFDAVIVIHLKSDKIIEEIALNAVDLTFHKQHCFIETTVEKSPVSDVVVDAHLQRVTFKLSKPAKGDFTLHVMYEGKIRPQLNGLYQTKYTNDQGENKIAAVTQFEPQDARKMVPCFDEPEWKATWNVTILHPKGTSAVSNGIELDQPTLVDGDFLQSRFKRTPAMASYLLAVLISEFTYKEGMTKNGVRFRIWSRPEAKETTKYALEAGMKCLTGLEDFYGVKFPLEKQDMVALPDFAMGAMENWGLITYRETALLYDENNYSMENKRRVATVVAHELAHMWFGDLVTPKWWNDIWLNEGFASFVENVGVDIISDNKFDMENTFVSEQHAYALNEDASRSSHPIINDVEYNEEIDDLFDTISYKKGATFISMLNHLLGKDNFQKGIKSYFEKYAYKNTEHGQLFAEWDKAVPQDMRGPDGQKLNVTEFALKWTTQMGYPYLTLVSHNSTHDEVTQTRYLINPNATERPKFANPKYNYKWDVPVAIQVGASKDVQLAWLPYEGHLYLPKTEEAVVLNADSYAIARMNYDEAGWRKILEQLEKDHTVYSQRTKYRIVSDVFALAEIDKISYDLALDFAHYIVKEQDRLPWRAFFKSLNAFGDFWGSSPDSKAIDDYKQKLLQPIIEKLDIKAVVESINSEESHIANGIKVTQWLQYCGVNKAACKQLKNEFWEGFRQPCGSDEAVKASQCSQVPPAIRSNIYCSAVREGDDDVYQLVMTKYKKESLQLESRSLLMALTCSHDVITLKRLLNEVLKREKGIVRSQDAGFVFTYLSSNEVASEFLLDFLFENWDQIYKQFKEEQSILNQIIEGCAANIRSRYQVEKLKSFVKGDKNAQKYYQFTKSEQLAEKRIAWLEKNGQNMVDLLQRKTGQL